MSLTTGGIPRPYRTPGTRPRRLWPRLWEPTCIHEHSRVTGIDPKQVLYADPAETGAVRRPVPGELVHGRRGRGAHQTPSAAGRGTFFQALRSVGLLVVALLGGLSPLEQPVDLVGVGVPPLPQPELETRQQHHRNGIGRRRGDHPMTIFASTGMNGDWAGMGAVTISTGSP